MAADHGLWAWFRLGLQLRKLCGSVIQRQDGRPLGAEGLEFPHVLLLLRLQGKVFTFLTFSSSSPSSPSSACWASSFASAYSRGRRLFLCCPLRNICHTRRSTRCCSLTGPCRGGGLTVGCVGGLGASLLTSACDPGRQNRAGIEKQGSTCMWRSATPIPPSVPLARLPDGLNGLWRSEATRPPVLGVSFHLRVLFPFRWESRGAATLLPFIPIPAPHLSRSWGGHSVAAVCLSRVMT